MGESWLDCSASTLRTVLKSHSTLCVRERLLGHFTLAVVQLGFTALRWASNVYLARRNYPQLKVRLSGASKTGMKLIFSFSVFSFLLHVSGSLIYATDNIVIGAFLPI